MACAELSLAGVLSEGAVFFASGFTIRRGDGARAVVCSVMARSDTSHSREGAEYSGSK